MLSCDIAPTAVSAVRLTLAVILAAAGISKLLAKSLRVALRASVERLGLPYPALLVPCIAASESALGVWLASGYRPAFAGAATSLLIVVFSSALVVLVLRGYDGPCGCFVARRPIGIRDILRNGVLLVSATLVWAYPGATNLCLDGALNASQRDVWLMAAALTWCASALAAVIRQMRQLLTPAHTLEDVR